MVDSSITRKIACGVKPSNHQVPPVVALQPWWSVTTWQGAHIPTIARTQDQQYSGHWTGDVVQEDIHDVNKLDNMISYSIW